MATTEITKTLKEITELVPHFIKLPEAKEINSLISNYD